MTSISAPGLRALLARLPARRRSDGQTKTVERVDASPVRQAIALSLATLSIVLVAFLVNLTGVSQLQHLTAQHTLYGTLRLSLAQGSTPIGPTTVTGSPVAPGTPVALMSAPGIGIAHEVIVQGTASPQTMVGIGHRRDTVMPCQTGSSVLMARAAGYGGVGSSWAKLRAGETFTITMGQGRCTYQVLDLRGGGDPVPAPPAPTAGALTLVTASGPAFFPTGVLRVDARMVGKPFTPAATQLSPDELPASEQAMGIDNSHLFALVMLLQAMIVIVVAAMWLWRRWRPWARTTAVVTMVPIALTVLFLTARNINYLLPNLL